MKRTSAAVVVALVGFNAGCGDDSNDEASGSSGEYCAELPEYFRVMGSSMAADATDSDRFDEWAAKAEDMAALAPDELRSHWDFTVDYSGRMAEAGGDLSALEPDDVEENGAAGNAIVKHATQECGINP